MRDNPFVKNFDELLSNIKEDIQNNEYSLYIADEGSDSIFTKVLVQRLTREINGKEIHFIAIRDVDLKENYKGKKLFTKFFKELNGLNINLIFHDIINEKFFKFLEKHNYHIFKEEKYGEELVSLYKLKV